MAVAFVLGNGVSRKGVNLENLRNHGKIYGCNALYREFTPDVLIATDRPISEQIQHSGYPLKNKFYTRKPLEGLGANRVPDQYWGYSSLQRFEEIAFISVLSQVYFRLQDRRSYSDD